jgi:hypothetical protein
MHKRLLDSVDERLYIYSEVLQNRVIGLQNNNFNEVYVSSCVSPLIDSEDLSMMQSHCLKSVNRPPGLVSLHNTFLTWFSLSPFLFFILYGFLFWKFGKNFIFLSLPTFFLSVGPGMFSLYYGLSLGSSLFEVKK